jgi:hypothetical protein
MWWLHRKLSIDWKVTSMGILNDAKHDSESSEASFGLEKMMSQCIIWDCWESILYTTHDLAQTTT